MMIGIHDVISITQALVPSFESVYVMPSFALYLEYFSTQTSANAKLALTDGGMRRSSGGADCV